MNKPKGIFGEFDEMISQGRVGVRFDPELANALMSQVREMSDYLEEAEQTVERLGKLDGFGDGLRAADAIRDRFIEKESGHASFADAIKEHKEALDDFAEFLKRIQNSYKEADQF